MWISSPPTYFVEVADLDEAEAVAIAAAELHVAVLDRPVGDAKSGVYHRPCRVGFTGLE
jgi:hypothetical protein